MNKRKLGNQGLTVSAMGLGCMGMSEFYGIADEKESIATIHRALEVEITFLDTSDMYGPYTNEQLVGKAVAGKREKVILATKFGIVRTGDSSTRSVNGRPEYVKKSIDGSLKRLGVNYVDLYYQHRVDPNVPIEETVGAMAELVQAGKVRYLGLSEAGPQTIRRAHQTHPISALQSEYSLWTRDPESEIIPTIRELGIGLVAYSPLGRGFLTGRFKNVDELSENDFRRYTPRFQDENFRKNRRLVEHLEKIAQAKGISTGQLALAWVLAQGEDIVPIVGTTKRKHLEENIKALDISFSEKELDNIREAIPQGEIAGKRYPEAAMKMLNL